MLGVFSLPRSGRRNGRLAVEAEPPPDPGDPETIAEFTFIGSGDGDGAVIPFGHSFPDGVLDPTDDLLIRSVSGNIERRTTWEPLATWPSGKVRTMKGHVELPELASDVTHAALLRKNETHSSLGSTLNWATATSGRSVSIKTWAPGDTTTPLWTYDALTAAASSTDIWSADALALTRRVESNVPSSGVQNTSGSTGVITSVRFVGDITITKDGFLQIEAQMCNDTVHKTGGGIARFGWTIEIDGVMVYNQRPASGVARDLLQYSRWIQVYGRKGSTTYDFMATERPIFIPDYEVLHASGLAPWYERDLITTTSTGIQTALTEAEDELTDPYWAWGMTRGQSGPGGQDYIGWVPHHVLVWMTNHQQARIGARLSLHRTRVFAAAGWVFHDETDNCPVHVDTWAKFNVNDTPSGSPSSSRGTVTVLPSGQGPTHNATDHILVDQAHRGDYYTIPAVLFGRRYMYDLAAYRSADASVRDRGYSLNTDTWNANGDPWRNFTPNHETGYAWAPRWPYGQQRAWAWGMRDIARANYILPDDYPQRDFYDKNAQAWINAVAHHLAGITAAYPDMGLPWLEWPGFRRGTVWFQGDFLSGVLAEMKRMGYNSDNFNAIYNGHSEWRAKHYMQSDALLRNTTGGYYLYYTATSQPDGYGSDTYLDSWADLLTNAQNTSVLADWSNVGAGTPLPDYLIGQASTILWSRYAATSLDVRAAAADALVYLYSQRRQSTSRVDFRASTILAYNLPQIATHQHPRHTWVRTAAPVIDAGQSFNCATGAAEGTIVGIVQFTGPIPRNSSVGLAATVNAFEITSQPNSAFSITAGGVIKRSGSGSVSAGSQTISVRPRTYEDDETLRQGSAVDITIVGV